MTGKTMNYVVLEEGNGYKSALVRRIGEGTDITGLFGKYTVRIYAFETRKDAEKAAKDFNRTFREEKVWGDPKFSMSLCAERGK